MAGRRRRDLCGEGAPVTVGSIGGRPRGADGVRGRTSEVKQKLLKHSLSNIGGDRLIVRMGLA